MMDENYDVLVRETMAGNISFLKSSSSRTHPGGVCARARSWTVITFEEALAFWCACSQGGERKKSKPKVVGNKCRIEKHVQVDPKFSNSYYTRKTISQLSFLLFLMQIIIFD